MGGIDVDEDDGFRIVAGDDGAVEEMPEGGFGEAAEEVVEVGREREGGAVGFADGPLKSKNGGEGLHFDEAGGEAAVGSRDEAEVGGEEVRMRVLIGGAPLFGDGGEGAGEVVGVGEELMGEVGAGGGHFFEEFAGEEAGGFRDGEGDVGARDGVEAMEKGAEGLRAEARVEVLAQGGNHRGRVAQTGNGE